jgi:hypothetical protein
VFYYRLRLGLQSGLLSSGFPSKILYTFLTSPTQIAFPFHLILLDLITLIISAGENKLRSSSLCSLLHSPLVSFPFCYVQIFSSTESPFFGLDDRGFESRQGLGIFIFTIASGPTLGPTQPPIQWVPGALSLEVKRPGREADAHLHLVPRSNNEWSYTSVPPIRLHGVVLS